MPNKALVQERAYPSSTRFLSAQEGGALRLTRWDSRCFDLPAQVPQEGPEVELVTSFFAYTARDGMSAWYPNFA
eukprot:CAMPEP_0168484488 /NCGR_PEP_ID=MMETSP0228-20121227/66123_1 /TAXON_ID=133427 /ORGANISM="Protoceratium reticulatum, Strain CCCM 535 (=CCMP 1889)" /LENGTH=73 /DNA_ID=CAMNT_0008501029 /DNA_START=1 /DNA_END=219 /DNA_ORIENTATION=+